MARRAEERTWPKMPHQKLRGNELFVFPDRITAGDARPLCWMGTWWRRRAMCLGRAAHGQRASRNEHRCPWSISASRGLGGHDAPAPAARGEKTGEARGCGDAREVTVTSRSRRRRASQITLQSPIIRHPLRRRIFHTPPILQHQTRTSGSFSRKKARWTVSMSSPGASHRP